MRGVAEVIRDYLTVSASENASKRKRKEINVELCENKENREAAAAN